VRDLSGVKPFGLPPGFCPASRDGAKNAGCRLGPDGCVYTVGCMRTLLALLLLTSGFAVAQNRVYELRTYTCHEGKLEALKARFRDHTIQIFERHHMESIGYWIPQDPERSKTTLIYILAHPSIAEAQKNWAAFRADPEWRKVQAESEAAGPITIKTESVFMDPADFSKLK
jgi:hypothetical protein